MTLADTALAKLAQASRIFQLRLRRAVQNWLRGPLRWLGDIIAQPILRVAATLPIAAWRAPVGPVDEQAHSVERAAATGRHPATGLAGQESGRWNREPPKYPGQINRTG